MEMEVQQNEEDEYYENTIVYVYSDVVRSAILKFLNECRRLTALWA